jgi:UDP-glucose 4-epimerase
LTEESPLRGNDDFDYARTKKRIEPMLEGFAGANPKTAVTVLRPCFVIGPGCGDPLTAHLRKRVVFVPRRALPMQFVHVTDVISILMHFLQTQTPGTFNVAAEGTIPMPEMVKLLGNLRLALFWPTIYFFNELAWRLRLRFVTEVPSSALRFLVFPSVMSTEKLRRETGYEFQYDTQAAFEDFARWASRPPRPSPSKDASRIAVRRALARLRAGDT